MTSWIVQDGCSPHNTGKEIKDFLERREDGRLGNAQETVVIHRGIYLQWRIYHLKQTLPNWVHKQPSHDYWEKKAVEAEGDKETGDRK